MFGMFGIPGMPMPLGRAPFMPMGQPPGIPENLQGKELEVLIFKNNTGGWRGWLLVFWRVRFRNLVIHLCKRINPVPLTAVSTGFLFVRQAIPSPRVASVSRRNNKDRHFQIPPKKWRHRAPRLNAHINQFKLIQNAKSSGGGKLRFANRQRPIVRFRGVQRG